MRGTFNFMRKTMTSLPIKDLATTNVETKRQEVFEHIQNLFGPFHEWFIAGSFANSYVTSPNDVDIYFYTEHDYRLGKQIIEGASRARLIAKSKYADTYIIPKFRLQFN